MAGRLPDGPTIVFDGESYYMGGVIADETARILTRFDGTEAVLDCAYAGAEKIVPAAWVVMVTARRPNDTLHRELMDPAGPDGPAFTLTRIGDCEAPSIIAAAVHAGHRFARDLERDVDVDRPLRHDRVNVGLGPRDGWQARQTRRYRVEAAAS
jgi:dimethylamine/trimethylamine dehydrogenase